jgi:anti-sigma factor RsiW
MNMKPDNPLEPDIARDATYHRAPDALRDRVNLTLKDMARAERRPAMGRWMLLAASFAAVSVVSWNLALMTASSRDGEIENEVLTAHVRSLMVPGRLVDVESTDQHTVKPWFAGKIDFAPPVRDLAADGYPLTGGRLDYIDGHPVAALTYKVRLHPVNVFVWPDAGASDAAPKMQSMKGYSIVHWVRGGMRYWAVSDAGTQEISRFAELMAAG